MERDFRKLTAWIEETLRSGVAEERKLLEWKISQSPAKLQADPEREAHAKAS